MNTKKTTKESPSSAGGPAKTPRIWCSYHFRKASICTGSSGRRRPIATGACHSVREFVEAPFSHSGVKISWQGKGVEEVAIDVQGALGDAGRVLVRIDPRHVRPTDVETLLGDPGKAERQLGWKAQLGFYELVAMMMESDLDDQKRDQYLQAGGYTVKNYNE